MTVTGQAASAVPTDLRGRNAIVVGASSGIGRAVAAELTGLGARVGWCARRPELLAASIEEAGGTGVAIPADISTDVGCGAVAETVGADLGRLDLVVIASGTSMVRMLADADAVAWEHVLRTNVIGPSLLVQQLLPLLRPDAVVGMLSSESVGDPFPGLVPYAASKAALEEMLRGWRREHPEVRFARVTVGATDGTDFARDFDPDLFGELFSVWVAQGHIPARVMDATDVGISIARTLGHAVLVPGVDVQDLVLRSPGGPMTLPS